jgi:hypothetical protein
MEREILLKKKIEEEDGHPKKKQSFAKLNLIHFIHLCHLQVSDLRRAEIYSIQYT